MFFMYVVAATVLMLLVSVGIAVFKQREIKVDVISRESVEEKEFFALRIESDDFLFLKEEENVTYIQSLDDVDDFKMVDLKKGREPGEDKLRMPSREKRVS